MNDGSRLGQNSEEAGDRQAWPPGLEAVRDQLAPRIAVLQAERARRDAGIEIRRPAWKNLVFTGGPGTGKSRAAAAVARSYRDLGLLPLGHIAEVNAVDLVDMKPWKAVRLVNEAARHVPGGVLLIANTHAWHDLPDHGFRIGEARSHATPVGRPRRGGRQWDNESPRKTARAAPRLRTGEPG